MKMGASGVRSREGNVEVEVEIGIGNVKEEEDEEALGRDKVWASAI